MLTTLQNPINQTCIRQISSGSVHSPVVDDNAVKIVHKSAAIVSATERLSRNIITGVFMRPLRMNVNRKIPVNMKVNAMAMHRAAVTAKSPAILILPSSDSSCMKFQELSKIEKNNLYTLQSS